MSILTLSSPKHKESAFNQPLFESYSSKRELDRPTLERAEKVSKFVLKRFGNKGEMDIPAATNIYEAWRQDATIDEDTFEVVEDVLALHGLAAERLTEYHGTIPEDRILLAPLSEQPHNPINPAQLLNHK